MAKRVERLRAAKDFAAVRTHGRATHTASLTLSWLANSGPTSRFGYIAGKRVGNAVTRNLVKRRLRAIITVRRDAIPDGYDIVLIAKPAVVQRSFLDIASEVEKLLQRAKLWHPVSALSSNSME
jgi:ribonuclease P protein component